MGLDIVVKHWTYNTVISENITHNVRDMWIKAGIYDALYNSNGKKVEEVLETLKKGYADMYDKPEEYRKLDAPNGWGTYVDAIYWLKVLIEQMERYPLGKIAADK